MISFGDAIIKATNMLQNSITLCLTEVEHTSLSYTCNWVRSTREVIEEAQLVQCCTDISLENEEANQRASTRSAKKFALREQIKVYRSNISEEVNGK